MRATSIFGFLMLLALNLVCTTPSLAQISKDGDVHIEGVIVTGQEEHPVNGALVELIVGHNVYCQGQSDVRGKFAIPISVSIIDSNETLILRVSHVSYVMLTKQISHEINVGKIHIEEEAYNLDECVVTSTRSTRHFSEIPVPTQLISSGQIARIAPVTMKDVLLYAIPGIEVSQHGGVLSISVQGYDADYITFLIDGEELAGLNNGTPDLTRLSPDNIERVEMIKGAGSALYGSNAIGGVINFITKEQKKPLSLATSAGYSNMGSWDGYVEGGLKRDKWSNTISGSLAREAAYMVTNRDETQSIQSMRNDVGRVSNKFRWLPSDRMKFMWDGAFSHRRQFKDEFRHDFYDYLTNNLKAIYSINERGTISASYNSDLSWRDRFYPQTNEGTRETIHKNYKHVLRLQYDLHFGEKSDLSLGAEGHGEHMLSYQIKSATAPKNIMYGVLFGQHLWRMKKGLDLMYGLRADIHSTYGLHLSPKVTLSYKNRGWMFRAGYAEAFKSPTVMQLYFDWFHGGGNGFMIYGNPNLKPEKASQFITGVEWKNAHLSISGGLTHTLFRDRIVMATDKENNQHYINVEGRGRMTVADAQLTWHPFNGFTVAGSYTFTHNPNYTEINGERINLNTTRPHNFLMRIEGYKSWYNKWSCSATFIGQYLSAIERTSVTPATMEIDRQYFEGYPIFRASASITYDNYATLTVGADNLLGYKADNINFQNASLTPGRVIFTKLIFRL